ncbi:thioesterase superfamily [Candidatus Koribacter versatilis Ellin345]|uniref:Acyl-coenzyme A thioesterase THEM4 n=1 Tax=Koribacter versatilis (strain Ellin345) TaxID=204669 RepID=Q1IQJ5_KORVE|nr:PaaI family thioesterase [Candidatus Koribacter versatilis]ABF40855.1 thioesterase superfamily [Candidatus Koribacter versatilis Ellin345]
MAPRLHGKGHHHKIPRNFCYGCGPDNKEGLQLKFVYNPERHSMVAKVRLRARYTGPPGHAHGGVIATVLDEAMGKVMKIHNVIALTSRMEIQYLKPVPLNTPLIAEGKPKSHRGRRYWTVAEIRNHEGLVLARSRGLFVQIDPMAKFGKHLEKMLKRVGKNIKD